MKILGIDTSTHDSSVAVLEDGKIVGEFTVNQKRTHSETLVPIIKDLLKLLAIEIGDIDLFAVGIGPGSFTGIRIGMTIAKTLAQVTGKPIVGISTLEALALNAQGQTIMPVLDARGGRIYYSLFDKNMNRLEEDKLIFAQDLVDDLSKHGQVKIIGDYDDNIQEILNLDTTSFVPSIHTNLIARGVCWAAKNRYEKGDLQDYKTLRANYVRQSQAERDLK